MTTRPHRSSLVTHLSLLTAPPSRREVLVHQIGGDPALDVCVFEEEREGSVVEVIGERNFPHSVFDANTGGPGRCGATMCSLPVPLLPGTGPVPGTGSRTTLLEV